MTRESPFTFLFFAERGVVIADAIPRSQTLYLTATRRLDSLPSRLPKIRLSPAMFCRKSTLKKKLLEAISRDGTQDDPLSEIQLAKISKHVLHWEAKGCTLGLSEVEMEDIKQDYIHSNEMQRVAMLRKWAKKYGDRATMRALLDVSIENNWNAFIENVCASLGYIENENSGK